MAITKIGNDFEQLGFMDSQRIVPRALRKGDTGANKYFVDDKVAKDRLNRSIKESLKGIGLGAALGNVIGGAYTGRYSGAGKGALLGAMGGHIAGFTKGIDDANREALKPKGIRPQKRPKKFFGYVEATPEAKEKYLNRK